MPTENRSSNTEMVSDLLPCPFCGEKPQITKHHREDIYSFMHRCQVLGPISWGFREDQQAHIEKWNAGAQPAPQPHPEPIAWMVGTAFWWTKEEAERDAAATGLPIVGLGPMTRAAPAEQHQGEPVAVFSIDNTGYRVRVLDSALKNLPQDGAKLYTHADPDEAEWSAMQHRLGDQNESLRAQLAEAQALLGECRENIRQGLYEDDPAWDDLAKRIDALSASAEPSVGILHDLAHRGPTAKATESLVHYGPPAASMPAGAKMGEPLEITGLKCENYKPEDPKYRIHLDKGLPESAPKYTSYRVFLVGGPDSAGIGYRSGLIYNQGDTLVIDGKTYTFGRLELKP